MNATELRLFYEALPGQTQQTSGRPSAYGSGQNQAAQAMLDKKNFVMEGGNKKIYLTQILEGKKPLTDHFAKKLLPVMQQYGFIGGIPVYDNVA